MNTEIIDYLKTLAKKEFFFISIVNMVLSMVIIICGFISLTAGASVLLYAIMFACATVTLATNSYKCFKRGSKNGPVFAVFAVGFATITGICVYSLIIGG